jgi:hypothetical protein
MRPRAVIISRVTDVSVAQETSQINLLVVAEVVEIPTQRHVP